MSKVMASGAVMAGKNTILQRLRMNQDIGFCDTERLMMRKIIICSLIDVFHEGTMECRMPMAIQTIVGCSRDNGPICCKIEKFRLTQLAFSNIGPFSGPCNQRLQ